MTVPHRIAYLYDVPLPNEHAATIQILKTGRALAEQGWRFTLHARGQPPEPGGLLATLGLERHERLHLRQGFPARPLTPGFRRLALTIAPPALPAAPCVVMSRGETGQLIAPGLRRSRRRPLFIYELHRLAFVTDAERHLGRLLRPGEPLPPSAERLRRREARTIAFADGLVFLTEELKSATRAAFRSLPPSVVAPSGVDALPPCDRPKDVDVIYVGKIERRKGVGLAIDAMRRLPGHHLRLVGDGAHLAWARAHAQALGIADRVQFTGRLPHAAVAAELAKARVGVCPLPGDVDQVSARFTSPLKLLEMMAAGLPVVATDLPPVRAICTDGRDALLVSADDADALAAGIRQLLEDAPTAQRLAAAARERATAFGWDARAARIAGLIENVRACGLRS